MYFRLRYLYMDLKRTIPRGIDMNILLIFQSQVRTKHLSVCRQQIETLYIFIHIHVLSASVVRPLYSSTAVQPMRSSTGLQVTVQPLYCLIQLYSHCLAVWLYNSLYSLVQQMQWSHCRRTQMMTSRGAARQDHPYDSQICSRPRKIKGLLDNHLYFINYLNH